MKKTALFFLSILILSIPSQVMAGQKIPILVYHSIDEFQGHGSKELYVTPKNFEDQMIYLRDHGYTLLTFERWQDIHKVNKPIFITFDDGYKNNLNAWTIFQKIETERFKPAGTLFVISDFIGRPNRLSPSDLKRMADSNFFSIQSHTATHPDLMKVTNYEFELNGSKDKIESITGKPVIALSYPYGNFNSKVVAEVKKYYQFGLTTTPELYSKTNNANELYLLPRIYIKYSTNLEEFAKIVEGI
ncbi:polysaccharide deacetylase family protein [Bacillus sp. S/N-304-OC-R1]|uniref:polysaccharide deacetylase family protein n=1 Tax=Bacillus sp. S/N-304-OC-R1 TaxID=2758034 RepID=UPI001C8D9AA0|nr:polysaccharide deacetylase family protein [Bacillus sp. S/N-304-OC-R1]MBY0122502.1 polysaccharide deacetylase family protein [Bacillus sp. S/N-304-OC-R1]